MKFNVHVLPRQLIEIADKIEKGEVTVTNVQVDDVRFRSLDGDDWVSNETWRLSFTSTSQQDKKLEVQKQPPSKIHDSGVEQAAAGPATHFNPSTRKQEPIKPPRHITAEDKPFDRSQEDEQRK